MATDWADYESLAQQAAEYLNARHQHLEETYHLGDYEQFDADLYAGSIGFSSGGTAGVTAICHPVGSLSHTSRTWLWAWANMSFPPQMRGFSKRARLVGNKLGFPRLREPKWGASEEEAWEVTAILAYLTESEGAYCCRGETADAYVVLSSVCDKEQSLRSRR